MKAPSKIPDKGFYYHYKHDPSGPVSNYAYEFISAGVHTEAGENEKDAVMAVYRPLYKDAFVYQAGKLFDLRPLGMWMGEVTKGGKTFPRFRKITDPKIIAELEAVKKEMYG
jgi:hypothetical protein